jgi:hypothetical protein
MTGQRLEERLAHLKAVISGKGENESLEFRAAKKSKYAESQTGRESN